jgi:ribosomal protein S18 acetylase RimI-like enzyme
METHILTYNDILKQKDLSLFVDTIYDNFIHLSSELKLSHTKENILKNLLSPNSIIIIMIENNKITGFLTGNILELDDRRRVFFISYIYVAENQRNKKLGTKLMKLAEKIGNQYKCIGMMLIFDTHDKVLVNFYENLGYMLDINLRRYEPHDVYYKTL